MKASEYELKTRQVSWRVYQVYIGACLVALVACPLVVWQAGKALESQAATFGIGLVAAALVIGVPLFLALGWADKQWSRLRHEQDEDARAENWQKFLQHTHKEADSGEDSSTEEEDVRPDREPEQ